MNITKQRKRAIRKPTRHSNFMYADGPGQRLMDSLARRLFPKRVALLRELIRHGEGKFAKQQHAVDNIRQS